MILKSLFGLNSTMAAKLICTTFIMYVKIFQSFMCQFDIYIPLLWDHFLDSQQKPRCLLYHCTHFHGTQAAFGPLKFGLEMERWGWRKKRYIIIEGPFAQYAERNIEKRSNGFLFPSLILFFIAGKYGMSVHVCERLCVWKKEEETMSLTRWRSSTELFFGM